MFVGRHFGCSFGKPNTLHNAMLAELKCSLVDMLREQLQALM